MDFRKKPNTDFRPVDELGTDEAREQVEALREGIDYHDYRYYVLNRPVISDATYDRLFQRLEDLEAAFPELQSDLSPTRRVGKEPVSGLEKVDHVDRMLSLNAVREAAEVEAFIDRVNEAADARRSRFSLEPKFDGLSVEVIYTQGRFERGATRGNGEVGEDISHNLKTLRSLPLHLRQGEKSPARLAVRGEVFMSRSGFTDLNRQRVENGDEPFANPRNAAAGLMRQLDSRQVAGKPLEIVFYELLGADGDWEPPASHVKILEQFRDWGLKTSPLNDTARGLAPCRDYHARLAEKRDGLDYEIDGIIIKADDRRLREQMGVRSRSPRWALAWKFPPREEVTTLEDIVISVGRTGILTPVALLQPVDVGGVTVSRATLHNEDEVHRKDVRPGDKVRIIRAGDVIPEVQERVPQRGVKRAEPFAMPDRCPSCGTQVVREGAYVVCPNGLSCPAQLKGHLTHFASRDALDIDHLGEKTARQLVERDLVHDLADLFDLSEDDLRELEGFADKSASQLHSAIQKALSARLDQFLYALGIRHVGQRIARILAEAFGSLEALMDADPDRLEAIPEIGGEIAESIHHFFDQKRNRQVIQRLQDAGLELEPPPASAGERPLDGLTFVFTGELEHYTRDEAQERVERLGGRATSSVSGETDYVVVGTDPGQKRDEAQERGVEILDEAAFREMVGEG